MNHSLLIYGVLMLLSGVCAYRERFRPDYYAVAKECNEVYNVTTKYNMPYIEPYYRRNWVGFKKKDFRVSYQTEEHVSQHIRKVCCAGYISYSSELCIPSCSNGCGQFGLCSQPEKCTCQSGYHFNEDRYSCEPVCEVDCINGRCTEPNQCSCDAGYHLADDNFTCKPVCVDCDNLEYCVEPHVCRCLNSYERTPMDRIDRSVFLPCKPVCERPCINSTCVEPNVCRCLEGYGDFDNDTFACEPKCNVQLQQEHSGALGCANGECVAPGTCSCYPGYRLSRTVEFSCEPVCDQECEHGKCVLPNICDCNDGYIQMQENSQICEPICSTNCTHGTCVAPEKCACDSGYELIENANVTTCQPICNETCIYGECSAPESCACLEGYGPSGVSAYICHPICDQACINGNCSHPNYCTCDDGFVRRSIEIGIEDPFRCIVPCDCQNGYCDDDNSYCNSCETGYDLRLTNGSSSCEPVCETGCYNGECIAPNECRCNENYIPANSTEGNTTCVHACGGDCIHGTCDTESRICSCYYGWTGLLCHEPQYCGLSLNFSEIINYSLGSNKSVFDDNRDSNASFLENTWTGPSCRSDCLEYISRAECMNQTSDNEAFQIICFLDKDFHCNLLNEVQKSTKITEHGASMKMTIIISFIGTLVIIASISLLISAKRKKARNARLRVIELHKQEDLLVEEDEGVSL